MPPEQHGPEMPSILELLHPAGFVRTARVLGTGPGRALVFETGDGPPQLVLLAGSSAELRDPSWVDASVKLAGTLAENGVVVTAGRSRALARAMAGSGLVPSMRLLHIPDLDRSRYVFPLGGAAARFALGGLVPLRPWKRLAARFTAAVQPSAFTSGSVVYQRAGSTPLLSWLNDLGETGAPADAILSQSWKTGGATVVVRFGEEARPSAVVKLGADGPREAQALESLGDAARRASASVPVLLGELSLGGAMGVVETFVEGRPAAAVIRGSERRGREVLEAIALWLERWNIETGESRPLERGDVDRFVLSPAERLADDLPAGYLAGLRRLGDACTGMHVVLVAAHNDLTTANVLLGEGDRRSVVDWHVAEPMSLPLCDLAYAAADVASAVGGHVDRPAGYAAAFVRGGAFYEQTRKLLDRAVESLRLDRALVDLCLQACWLRHADNERSQMDQEGKGARPFLSILRQATEQMPV